MYRWYKESFVCYVYLDDVSSDNINLSADGSPFRKSRWFTRGWTLQELVAPENVSFFSNSWSFLGARSSIEILLEEITGIPFVLLSEYGIHYFGTAQRMCWAAKRKTTRREDIAYCLLGIFNVNMPLSYGEGDKAFRRLQEEIIRQSTDQTILAWGFQNPYILDKAHDSGGTTSILARSPSQFIGCEDMVPCESEIGEHFEITQKGIRVELQRAFTGHVVLKCRSLRHIDGCVAIMLHLDQAADNTLWSKWPELSMVDFIGTRLKKENPVIIRPTNTSYRALKFQLQIATVPSTASLLKYHHKSSIVIVPSKRQVYELILAD